MRMLPQGAKTDAEAYSPAFDIVNFMPTLYQRVAIGLQPEHWPGWLQQLAAQYPALVDAAALQTAMRQYLFAVDRMERDPAVDTQAKAFTASGFSDVDPFVRAIVLARIGEFTTGLFHYAVRETNMLVPGERPTRADITAALDAAAKISTPAPARLRDRLRFAFRVLRGGVR